MAKTEWHVLIDFKESPQEIKPGTTYAKIGAETITGESLPSRELISGKSAPSQVWSAKFIAVEAESGAEAIEVANRFYGNKFSASGISAFAEAAKKLKFESV